MMASESIKSQNEAKLTKSIFPAPTHVCSDRTEATEQNEKAQS